MAKRIMAKQTAYALLFCSLLPGFLLPACAPGVRTDQRLVVFAKSERFGPLAFSDLEKKALMSDALLSQNLKALTKQARFSVLSGDAVIVSAVALYQVDGRQRPPKLKAGYEFELLTGQDKEVKLRNEDTGLEAVVSLGL